MYIRVYIYSDICRRSKYVLFMSSMQVIVLFYLLSPWSRVLLEKLKGPELVKKLPAFYGTRRFITAYSYTSARHLSLSWASSIQSMTAQIVLYYAIKFYYIFRPIIWSSAAHLCTKKTPKLTTANFILGQRGDLSLFHSAYKLNLKFVNG